MAQSCAFDGQYDQQMSEQAFEQQPMEEQYQQQQQQQMELQRQQQQMYEEQARMMEMQQQQQSSTMQQCSSMQKSSSMQQSPSIQQSSSMKQSSSMQKSSSMQQSSSMQKSSSMQQSSSTQQNSNMQKNIAKAPETAQQKMARLEAEAKEQVREAMQSQYEARMKKLHPPVPPPPKEITVIAGDGKAVRVRLGETEEEDGRRQVAEAAGLKHVLLPNTESKQNSDRDRDSRKGNRNGVKEDDSERDNPWAGSLRHVPQPNKGGNTQDRWENPWAGSLRHVSQTHTEGKADDRKTSGKDEDRAAPWMGTLRHVVNGSVTSQEEVARMEAEEEEGGLCLGSMTVSSALLQVLLPKLLTIHEASYSPINRGEAKSIMEEILGMQAGLNPDQQADGNEEAQMIITAILQGEIDKSIYSSMADDLEMAKLRMNKKKEEKGLPVGVCV